MAIAAPAAALLGLGFVLQQRVAQAAARDSLSPGLLVDLLAQPMWLAGILAMVGGQVLGGVALGEAGVTLVEPLLSTNLLVALALARVLSAQRLGWREWAGALMLTAGVAGFVLAARPGPAVGAVDGPRQGLFIVVVVAVVVALVAWTRGRSGAARARVLAAAAGLLFGLQDGFTRQVFEVLEQDGPGRLLTSWSAYAVVVVAVLGLLLAQSAFKSAAVHASLPPMTVAEPLVAIAYGVGVFGEPVRVAPMWLACEIVTVAAMILGIVLVTRSRVLSPPPTPDASRPS